ALSPFKLRSLECCPDCKVKVMMRFNDDTNRDNAVIQVNKNPAKSTKQENLFPNTCGINNREESLVDESLTEVNS
ncbi:MAG: hypothetical protein ACTTJS_08510, partial [Wolinella sp.]